ncbi:MULTISPECIES: hypothetical protein [unclassified Pseudomonas]|uniref:hypothetical protein n=1 Tax=unclassified Pseudomonas TaxID=196821 RepID=UPI002448F4CB|nr:MULTISPECIES: hypothetical protein [unclassified Pseudomonas]MDH0303296.1 hypothetical protein [Pseudomonas sp. GD04091]MDH1985320.1 hypothetical protein [Pseudomonas sp. GD03689]
MSLYYLQKAIYQVNREPQALLDYQQQRAAFIDRFDLCDEEQRALSEPDVGLLYVLGVNGQLLMHFAACNGYDWPAYIRAMTEGLRQHGAVRDGLYACRGGVS